MSTHDPLTIAYLAMGAQMARLAHTGPDCAEHEGELDFIHAVIDHASMLDEMFDEYEERFAGVFVYDIAEPFGNAYATAMLRGDDFDADATARRLFEVECA